MNLASKRTPETCRIETERARVLAEVSRHLPSARSHFEAAFAGKSRKAAVTAFCVQCVGYDRDEVRNCTSWACPLFPYRPYATNRKTNDRGA